MEQTVLMLEHIGTDDNPVGLFLSRCESVPDAAADLRALIDDCRDTTLIECWYDNPTKRKTQNRIDKYKHYGSRDDKYTIYASPKTLKAYPWIKELKA